MGYTLEYACHTHPYRDNIVTNIPFWATNVVNNCFAISPDDKVMLITDEPGDYIRDPLRAAIQAAKPADLWEYVLMEKDRPLLELPQVWLDHIDEFDACIELFTKVAPGGEGRSRLQRVNYLAGKSIRYAWAYDISPDILDNEMSADYNEVAALTLRLNDRMQNASDVHITTASGTDFKMSIKGRPVRPDTGQFSAPGAHGNLPAGECYVAPLEDSANGLLVVDKSFPGILIEEPIRMTFENGRVVSIEGGEEAEHLKATIQAGEKQPNGEGCRTIAELGIGTNPKARLTGATITDEKVMGTIHIAIGHNQGTYGGVNAAPIHMDGVVGDAMLMIDGKTFIDAGKFLV